MFVEFKLWEECTLKGRRVGSAGAERSLEVAAICKESCWNRGAADVWVFVPSGSEVSRF